MLFRFSLIFFLTSLTVASRATTYYLSNSTGNDLNTGVSPSSPWQSLNKVNSYSFSAGDSILFKRNDAWHGQLIPQSGTASFRNYYGAYGSGELPQILGSVNKSSTSDWNNVGNNVWQCSYVFPTDVGNIIFNNAASVGVKKWNQSGLQNQGDFWFNLSTNEVQLYSSSNPGSFYTDIELAIRENVIDQTNRAYVTFENLSVKYGGAHGFGGANTSNIIINACERSYMGGGDLDLDGTTRFGNGVEFWGNASNNTVSKCKIWEIYDTGLTNQNHSTVVTQTNLKYQNNVIWNCGLSSFEFWCKPEASVVSDIRFENNTCLYAGGGWGIQRPDHHGVQILVSGNTAQTGTVYLRNNVLYQAQRTIYAFADNANGTYEVDYNLIYQPSSTDTLIAFFPSNSLFIYADYSSYTGTIGKDGNSVFDNPNFSNVNGADFSLSSTSLAIDAGINTSIAEDIEGNPRPYNGLFDIGAYEFSEPAGIHPHSSEKQLSIYPNPSGGTFRVKFNSSLNEPTTLSVFNAQGQNIATIKDYRSLQQVNFDHLKNGLYWLTLFNASGKIETKKIAIQK